MKWNEFLKLIVDLPVIETEHLFVGVSNPKAIEVQISRWAKAGKLIQLKRGVYLLSEPYRKIDVFGAYVASVLKKPSYLSLEKALEYHNLIPEAVPVYTSVTTKRQGNFISKFGTFDYRHIKNALFWGYNSARFKNQTAFIASPEKALLDFVYLKEIDISRAYVEELRLQNLEKINLTRLIKYAKQFKKRRIIKGAELIKEYIIDAKKRERTL